MNILLDNTKYCPWVWGSYVNRNQLCNYSVGLCPSPNKFPVHKIKQAEPHISHDGWHGKCRKNLFFGF